MNDSPIAPLADAPDIASLDELFSIWYALGKNTVGFCDRLAEVMRACANADTVEVFESLATRERTRLAGIRQQAKQASASAGSSVDETWLEQALKNDLAREIADNPYLMTPYRALRLAVANKERVFEIMSTLIANTDDPSIRQHAEIMARMELAEIAELRLRRRRASRNEIETVIEAANLEKTPLEMGDFIKNAQTVETIIRQMTLSLRAAWASETSAHTKSVLERLLADLHDFPDMQADGGADDPFKANEKRDDANLFFALKSVLRELESAVDLFLTYAENAKSEEVVHAAQTRAGRHVRHIAKIRDELNLRILDE